MFIHRGKQHHLIYLIALGLLVTPLLSCEERLHSTMVIAVQSGVFSDFVIEVRGSSMDERFEKKELTLNEFGELSSPILRVNERGVIELEFTAFDEEQQIVSGTVAIELRPAHEWTVRIWRKNDDRTNCIACTGAESFPIEPPQQAPFDRVVIAWSGRPIGSDFIP